MRILSSQRTDLQILVNEPVRIKLREDWTVEIHEPTNSELGEYLALMNNVVARFLRENAPLIKTAIEGGDVNAVPFEFGAITDALDLLVARIVDRDVDIVRNELTARQSAGIVRAFLDVLGWEFLRETFLQAMRAYQAAGAKTESAAVPKWPSESSPK